MLGDRSELSQIIGNILSTTYQIEKMSIIIYRITNDILVDHPPDPGSGGSPDPARHVTRVIRGAEDRVTCEGHVRGTRELEGGEGGPGLVGEGGGAGATGAVLSHLEVEEVIANY